MTESRPPVPEEARQLNRSPSWQKPAEVYGAVAAAVAGVAWIATGLLRVAWIVAPGLLPDPRDSWALGFVFILLFVVALIGTLGGLVGLHARQRESYGRLGRVGFLLALIWTVSVLALTILSEVTLPPQGVGGLGIGILVVSGVVRSAVVERVVEVVVAGLVGTGVLDLGLALMGIATLLRDGTLPRWCGWLLIIGAGGSFLFGGLVLGLVWLALAYALWSRRSVPAD